MTNEYIHTRLEIVGPEYSNSMFGGIDFFKNLENNCLCMDKSYHTYFSGTGKIIVMKLDIFLTKYYYFVFR